MKRYVDDTATSTAVEHLASRDLRHSPCSARIGFNDTGPILLVDIHRCPHHSNPGIIDEDTGRSSSILKHDAPHNVSGAQFVDPLLDVAHRLISHRCLLDLAGARCAFFALQPRQLLAHQPVHHVDRLERADHHLEMCDQASVFVEGNDVDAVNLDPFDLGLKLQHCAIIAAPLADVSEARAAHHLVCTR
jgi:hypothetical protein